MVQCSNYISVAGKLHVGGGVALIITESTVGENNQRELLTLFHLGGIVKMYRHFTETAVLLKGIGTGTVNHDHRGLCDGILSGDRKSFIAGKEESRYKKQADEKNAEYAVYDGRTRLLFDVIFPAPAQPSQQCNDSQYRQKTQQRDETPFLPVWEQQCDQHDCNFCCADKKPVFQPDLLFFFLAASYNCQSNLQCRENHK